MVHLSDVTMVIRNLMPQEVFDRISRYEASHQIGKSLSSEFATPVTSVLWAFNFAGVLEPEFVEAVREVLRIVGCDVHRSHLSSHTINRF